MMKRVGLCNFKQFDVSCKMPQCLRFGGVNANGAVNIGDDKSASKQKDCDGKQRSTEENFPKEKICDCHRSKGNILNTIRRKWRKNRRGKRCEGRNKSDSFLNMCQHNPENCEQVNGSCVKHHLKKQKPGSKASVSPMPSSLLRSQCQPLNDDNNDVTSTDLIQPEIITSANDQNEDCSCFGSPNRKTNGNSTEKYTAAKSSKLQARASRSLSDISCAANIVSSPASKTDSESDLCRISSLITDASYNENSAAYANQLCITADQNIGSEAPFPAFQPGQKVGNLTQELYKLSKYGWYWGPINRSEAESKLIDQPDGAFLVRDSSDDRYILSLSFRSHCKTLHTRIEHSSGLFSFYSQPEPEGHTSIVELINQSMCYSQSGVFCYSRSRSPGSPSFPVRLTKPISRFTQVRSLQYLCRFVIRQYTRYDHIQKLPLPSKIKGYLEEGHY